MFGSGEATSKRGILTLAYPISRGIVNNWDDIEKFLHHTFYNELRVAPEEHPTIFTEPALNPPTNREKITQMVFETYNVPAFYMIPSAICSLYASGRTSGIVLESGSATSAVPILSTGNNTDITSSKIWKSGVVKVDIGGSEVADYLSKLLEQKGLVFTTTAEKELVQDMKTSQCFVSQDYRRDMSFPEELFVEAYELPDGQIISLGYERFQAPEMLFDPTLAGIEAKGIHKLLEQAALAVPKERRPHDLWKNVVLAGGNTCFPGIGQRLQKELTQLLKESDPNATPTVIAPPERPISSWIGTSIFGSLSSMDQLWITKDMYDEEGPNVIHTKCNHYLEEESN